MTALALIEKIDRQLAASTHLVLIRAVENIGQCSYARWYPVYRKLNSILFASYGRFRYRGGDLRGDIRHARQQMYQQPCLICEWCQRRKRPWMVRT